MSDHGDEGAGWEQQQYMLDRERETVEALNRCIAAGAKVDDIKTLARECGVDIRYLTIEKE